MKFLSIISLSALALVSVSALPKGPKKYILVNGVSKLNPEYTNWQKQNDQAGAGTSMSPQHASYVLN
jgi:hypothetical protein